MQFANNLRNARKRAGLTQAALAARLGVRRETVACYETHARQPDIEMLARLAAECGVTADELLGGEQPEVAS